MVFIMHLFLRIHQDLKSGATGHFLHLIAITWAGTPEVVTTDKYGQILRPGKSPRLIMRFTNTGNIVMILLFQSHPQTYASGFLKKTMVLQWALLQCCDAHGAFLGLPQHPNLQHFLARQIV